MAAAEARGADVHHGVGLAGAALEALARLAGVDHARDAGQILEPRAVVGRPAAGEFQQLALGPQRLGLVAELPREGQDDLQLGIREVLGQADEHGGQGAGPR